MHACTQKDTLQPLQCLTDHSHILVQDLEILVLWKNREKVPPLLLVIITDCIPKTVRKAQPLVKNTNVLALPGQFLKYVGRTSTDRDEIPSMEKLQEKIVWVAKIHKQQILAKKILSRKVILLMQGLSTIRTNEAIRRKNRELLSVLHAQQEQERLSRSSTQDDSFSKETTTHRDKQSEPVPVEQVEMETVTVITRGTSPTPVTAPTSASRISTTPWSSDDAKLTSLSNKQKGIIREKKHQTIHVIVQKVYPEIILQKACKKQLPPQIPKSEAASKSNSLHSFQAANKDFRKSVLNMNSDKSKNQIGRRSNSASSADSDAGDPDATDVSENLTSYKSYHTSSSSKLPHKVSSSDKSLYHRCRRSPSSDASTSCHTSSSEEDPKAKHENIKRKSGNSSRTSVVVSSVNELLSLDKSPKPPHSPRQKTEKASNQKLKLNHS
ncbi:hypothetical protein NQ315_004050 [Exocentrus adspersus]|uniref:Uncharacterized protein n=1 Tax=Exocentrus adspersus TaxID=1586481 RepID=A0AAV8W7I3_9CUCU|nr:hypothetical protein NQ315_004050 [Exocentrus adspersus]